MASSIRRNGTLAATAADMFHHADCQHGAIGRAPAPSDMEPSNKGNTMVKWFAVFVAVLGALLLPQMAGGRSDGVTTGLLTPGNLYPGAYTISGGLLIPAWAPTANPGQQGSSRDTCYVDVISLMGIPGCGFDDNVIADWTSVPYSMDSGVITKCVLAHHLSGIKYVQIAVDGGTFASVPTQTGPSGSPEYCATVTDAAFPTDGLHEWRAIVCPNDGWCRILQSSATVTAANTGTGGVALFTYISHGQYFNKPVTILSSSDESFTVGSTYCISSKNIGPTDFDGSHFELATACGPNGSPITLAGTTATLTVAWAGAPFQNEKQPTQGSSYWDSTNYHGTITTQTAYVNSMSGVDLTNCNITRVPSGGPAAPCATMSGLSSTLGGAVLSMIPTNAGSGQTVGGAAPGCMTFIAAGNVTGAKPYLVGEPVQYATTGTADPGLINDYPYFIHSVNSSTDAVTLSQNPGGSCVVAGGGGSGTRRLLADQSYNTIYLMCDKECASPPTNYVLGGSSTHEAALLGYFTIAPAPGTAAANVPITESYGTDGIGVDKMHVTTDILSHTVTLVTNADSPCSTPPTCPSTFYFNTSDVPPWIAADYSAGIKVFLVGGAVKGGGLGCAWFVIGDGSKDIELTSAPTTVGQPAGTTAISVTSTSQTTDCPEGTPLTFAVSAQPASGYSLWYDTPMTDGPGRSFRGPFSLFGTPIQAIEMEIRDLLHQCLLLGLDYRYVSKHFVCWQ